MSDETPNLTAQCSRCHSVFRVQPQHLAVAGGWLQCGVCGNVFHTVFEEPAKPVEPAAAEAEPEVPVEQEPLARDTVAAAIPPEPAPSEPPVEETPEPAAPLAEAGGEPAGSAPLAGLAQRMAEEETNSSIGPKLESIILVDPDVPVGDLGPLPTFDSQEVSPPPPTKSASPLPTAATVAASDRSWTPRQPLEEVKRKGRSRVWLWSLLAVLLLIALVSQLVYFLRDDLAVRYPQLRPHLLELCRTLDCKLTLPRDTRLVTILGSDLQTENSGNLALAVTLANRSDHAMAWPVLELTLTDVKDQPIGRRIFAPSEYLPSPELESAGIQPLSEVPLTLKLQTRDIRAVGYRLQMFY